MVCAATRLMWTDPTQEEELRLELGLATRRDDAATGEDAIRNHSGLEPG